MSPRERGDALVIFGMTGDLAFRQIFPALQRMIQAGDLDVPVVGVAREHWNLEKLQDRARKSLEASGDGLDPAAFSRLCKLMRYAGGTYDDPKTYGELANALQDCDRPVHYLAIPPALFETAVTHLGGAGLAELGRVVVEKPFGRDLASAQELNRALLKVYPEERVYRIDHFLGKTPVPGRGRSPPPSPRPPPPPPARGGGTASTCGRSRSPWRRTSTSPTAARSTTASAPSAT